MGLLVRPAREPAAVHETCTKHRFVQWVLSVSRAQVLPKAVTGRCCDKRMLSISDGPIPPSSRSLFIHARQAAARGKTGIDIGM